MYDRNLQNVSMIGINSQIALRFLKFNLFSAETFPIKSVQKNYLCAKFKNKKWL